MTASRKIISLTLATPKEVTSEELLKIKLENLKVENMYLRGRIQELLLERDLNILARDK